MVVNNIQEIAMTNGTPETAQIEAQPMEAGAEAGALLRYSVIAYDLGNRALDFASDKLTKLNPFTKETPDNYSQLSALDKVRQYANNEVVVGIAVGAGALGSFAAATGIASADSAQMSKNKTPQAARVKSKTLRGYYDASATSYPTPRTTTIKASRNQPVECSYTTPDVFQSNVGTVVTARCVYKADNKLHATRKNRKSDPTFKKHFKQSPKLTVTANMFNSGSIENLGKYKNLTLKPNKATVTKFLITMACDKWPDSMDESDKLYIGYSSPQPNMPCLPPSISIQPRVTYKPHFYADPEAFNMYKIMIEGSSPNSQPSSSPTAETTAPTGDSGPTGSSGPTS